MLLLTVDSKIIKKDHKKIRLKEEEMTMFSMEDWEKIMIEEMKRRWENRRKELEEIEEKIEIRKKKKEERRKEEESD